LSILSLKTLIRTWSPALLAALAAAAPARGEYRADFATPGGNLGWEVRGAARQAAGPEGWAVAGAEQVVFLAPGALVLDASRDRVFRLTLALSGPRLGALFWRNEFGETGQVPLEPAREAGFQEIRADLGGEKAWRGRTGGIGLVFQGPPGGLILGRAEFGPWTLGGWFRDQAAGFWRKRPFNPGTINGLSSPPLLGRTLAYWLNLAALGVVLGSGALCLRAAPARRARTVAAAGGALLALWILSDLRETVEQARLVEEITAAYLRPPAEEKTFPGLGDFYRFVDFCRRNIPEDSIFRLLPDPYWPFDCRLRYFLYPSRIENARVNSYFGALLPKYFIVYQSPEIILDGGGRLLDSRTGVIYSDKGSLTARYSPTSFIYKAEPDSP